MTGSVMNALHWMYDVRRTVAFCLSASATYLPISSAASGTSWL